MINSHTYIGYVAGIIVAAAYIPYIRSILHNKTKPHRASFAIWSLLGIITTASYIAAGARITIWAGAAYAVLSTVVFVLSLKYGVGRFSRLDSICLLGALFGITLWLITDRPLTALYAGIASSLLGTIPTLLKVYNYPYSEDLLAWLIDSAGSILNFFALTSFSFNLLIYPLWSLVGGGSITLLILIRRNQLKELSLR